MRAPSENNKRVVSKSEDLTTTHSLHQHSLPFPSPLPLPSPKRSKKPEPELYGKTHVLIP
jgi:hypothetical protein